MLKNFSKPFKVILLIIILLYFYFFFTHIWPKKSPYPRVGLTCKYDSDCGLLEYCNSEGALDFRVGRCRNQIIEELKFFKYTHTPRPTPNPSAAIKIY